jgi:hypothetical protein
MTVLMIRSLPEAHRVIKQMNLTGMELDSDYPVSRAKKPGGHPPGENAGSARKKRDVLDGLDKRDHSKLVQLVKNVPEIGESGAVGCLGVCGGRWFWNSMGAVSVVGKGLFNTTGGLRARKRVP